MGILFMSKIKKELKVKKRIGATSSLSKRKFFKKNFMVSLPNLIESQTDSYDWFLEHGFQDLIDEINPVKDNSGNLEVTVSDFYLDEPKYIEPVSKEKNISFEAPLKAKASLLIKKTGEIREQEIYLGDFPIMTDRGTFIINGVERVVVHQLIRSPGVFFTMDYQKGKKTFYQAQGQKKILEQPNDWKAQFELGIEYIGVHYTAIEHVEKVYFPEIAEFQHKVLNKILSNEGALLLMELGLE
jgi:DNA-directed RNA polymerase subunit beta